jgi:hypothetical protein
MLHASTSIILGTLGFSLLIAGLDFVRRRARHRILEPLKRSIPPDSHPKIVRLQMNTVAESRTVAPIEGIASLPHTLRPAPNLPFGELLVLPKPNPRLPPNRKYVQDSISWWQ